MCFRLIQKVNFAYYKQSGLFTDWLWGRRGCPRAIINTAWFHPLIFVRSGKSRTDALLPSPYVLSPHRYVLLTCRPIRFPSLLTLSNHRAEAPSSPFPSTTHTLFWLGCRKRIPGGLEHQHQQNPKLWSRQWIKPLPFCHAYPLASSNIYHQQIYQLAIRRAHFLWVHDFVPRGSLELRHTWSFFS